MRSAPVERFEDATVGTSASENRLEAPPRRRVLLVDDNVSVRESLSLLLRMAGFDVVEARDGLEAFATLESTAVDLVITDLQMPGMHGADFIRRVRETLPALAGTHIIAISVHGPNELDGAREAGADAWVDKLADFDEILAAAHRLLDEEPGARS